MRITIDRNDCTSCELCWTTCPEVFEQNPDDLFSQIVEPYRVDGRLEEGEAPEEFAASVREAAEGCPVEIIHLHG